MDAKIIKTEEEYNEALTRLDKLMDAVPGTNEGEELELLSLLIEKYEDEHYPISLPDPVEAIKFRMEQQGLTQKDLIPYIGSQGKVSEVLNHRRPLSLTMIRNLAKGLEIPAEVLIREPGGTIPEKRFNPEDFPFTEMFNRGYFTHCAGTLTQAKQQAEECLESLFSVFQNRSPEYALCRSSEGEMDKNALAAWQAQVLTIANQQKVAAFNPENFTEKNIFEIVRLSAYTTGPLKARDSLAQIGIPFVTLHHLPRTYLDGACFLNPEGRPVIGMTLRHDRQDNFWFTLAHELAHVYLHLIRGDDSVFADNTEHVRDEDCDDKEREANQFCSDILIPPEAWEKEQEILLTTTDTSYIGKLAESLGVCPAIIAGRIRHEKKDFTLHSSLLGNGEIKSLFEGA